MSEKPYCPATFFLVHGTWAWRARWTCKGSALREQLVASAAASGREAHFVVLPWRGWNRSRDRVAAAQDLAHHINQLPEQHLANPIFLVGHSHGGSVIANFLTNYSELRTLVTGSAFLSTPFVALQIKDDWRALFLASAFAASIISFII